MIGAQMSDVKLVPMERSASLVQRNHEKQEFNTLAPNQVRGEIKVDGPLKAAMKKRAQSGVSAIQQQFFSPFRIRPSLETPTKRVDLNEWYRYYFKHDPYVGTAIELHATYPLCDFELDHEDSSLKREFNEVTEQLDLVSLLQRMGLEYWVVGECFPFGFLDDPNDPRQWERFILLDPDKIKINKHPMAVGRHNRDYFIRLEPDADLKKIVDHGPNHPNTGPLYRNIPMDVIAAVKSGQSIPLHPLQASHFKREVNAFNVRGESIISRILQDLMYLDKLRDAQYAIADRHVTPKEFYMIGEPGDPADQAELSDFENILQQTYFSPNTAVIYHHALKIQWEGASGRILPLKPEFDLIEKRLLAGLMMSSAFLHGEGPTYANATVALDVLIARYMDYRKKLERWVIGHVFDPICRMNDIYKPTDAELKHRIKVKKKKMPWVPKMQWERGSMRDDQFKTNLTKELVTAGLLPREDLYRIINKRSAQVEEELQDQAERDKEKQKKGIPIPGQPQMAGGGGAGGLPAPPGGGGGGPPPGAGLPKGGLPPGAPKIPGPPGGGLPMGTPVPNAAGLGPSEGAGGML